MKISTPYFLVTLGLGFLFAPAAMAQQTVGATTAPGSTLDVRGSVGANYRAVTAATYTMTATDYYVVYNGTAAGTVTLPAAGSGSSPLAASFKGRLYSVKNTTAAQTLTVTPAGSETIDGSTGIAVPAGQSVQLVSTGATSGATWEIVAFAAATSGGAGAGVTASNGLTASNGNVTLGGTLTQATTITQDANQLVLTGGRVSIGGNTAAPNSLLRLQDGSNNIGGLTDDDTYLKLGADNAAHLLVDYFGIQSKATTTTANSLRLNPYGGAVNIGATTASGLLNVSGTLGSGYTGGLNLTNTSPISGNTATQQLSITPGFIGGTGITGNVPTAVYELPGAGFHIFSDNVIPEGNNAFGLGNTDNRWSAVFGVNANFSSAAATTAAFTSTAGDPNGVVTVTIPATNSTGTISNSEFVQFFRAGTGNVGSIAVNAAGTGTDYKTTSDIRLKENIRPSLLGLAEVLKIQVRDYAYKADAAKTPQTGFLAQQLYTVFPMAVTKGGEDATINPWLVDYSKLTPLLTKAIQEQQAEIEALKAANARLQAQADGAAKTSAEMQASLQGLAEQVKLLQAGGATATTK